MARNVEIKARLSEDQFDRIFQAATELADRPAVEILQTDTFFRSIEGRLKLREFNDGTGELIFYQRPNQSGPKLSGYYRFPADAPEEMLSSFSKTNGILGVVKKHRTLFLIGATRVHMDRVEELGTFIELEVVLSDDQTAEFGSSVADGLMVQLGIEPDWLIETAYVDLLLASKKP